MNDHIEAAIEATSEVRSIHLSRNTVIVIAGLATYGAVAACQDGYTKVRGFVANRKAKKAAEKVETSTPEQ